MSELTAAMRAAVDSVDTDRRRRPGTPADRRQPAVGPVQLREEHDLPPVISRRGSRETFSDVVRGQFGTVGVAIWTTLRETVILVGLFWVCAIGLAFVEVEGAVTVPGVGEATVITVALVAASVLRAVLAALSRGSTPR